MRFHKDDIYYWLKNGFMEQKTAKEKCNHVWDKLGFSSHNGKIYDRCVKCGAIKEGTLLYII